MPELPEVEAVCRKLKRSAIGARIRSVQVLRPRSTHPQNPALLEQAAGGKIVSIERRGKNILLHLDSGSVIRVHLRMTGDLLVIPDGRHHSGITRVLFVLDDGRGLAFEDRRVLGTVHLHTAEELQQRLKGVGIDPLTRAFTPEFLVDAAKKSKRPAKLFLMDQKPVSGLGNIYAAESLFRAGIHPERTISKVRRPALLKLHAAIREVLREAVRNNARAYRQAGDFDGSRFDVYGRAGERCPVCGRAIARIEQGGRSTYFCPKCQR